MIRKEDLNLQLQDNFLCKDSYSMCTGNVYLTKISTSTRGVQDVQHLFSLQGHVRHNWKTRWFILYDEALVYFRKKDQVTQWIMQPNI